MSFAQRRASHRISNDFQDFRHERSPPRQGYRSGSTGKRSHPKSRSPRDNDGPHVYCAGVRIYPSSSTNSFKHNYGVRTTLRRGGAFGGRRGGSWTRGRGGRMGQGMPRLAAARADVSPIRNSISARTAFHVPAYDISPDRTNVDIPEIDNRKELLKKMRLAKDSDNLDEYYRYRELLNAGAASTRRSLRTKDVDINDLELEEIDCIDTEEETCHVEDGCERKRSKDSKHRRVESKEERTLKSSSDREKSSRRTFSDEKVGKTLTSSSDGGIKRKLAEENGSDEQRHRSVHRYSNDNGTKAPKIDGIVESRPPESSMQLKSDGGRETLLHSKVIGGETDEEEDEDDATFLQFAEDSVDVEAMVKAAATGDEDRQDDGCAQEDHHDEDDVEEEDAEDILGAHAVVLDMEVEPAVATVSTAFPNYVTASNSVATAPSVQRLKYASLGRLLAVAMKSISIFLAGCGHGNDDVKRIAANFDALSSFIRLFSNGENSTANGSTLKSNDCQKGQPNLQSTDVSTLAELSLGAMIRSFLSNECRTQPSE